MSISSRLRKALVEVLKSDEVKAFIEETWSGAVVPYEVDGAAETEAEIIETEAE